ncbi:DUF86 domain-containing protein [Paenibacillus sp. IB182496]|uniref:DUF86 domain-containing protein n=1 Tax=Paenibacillus sabuli TaxID=2772509 RepID=A0A927BUK1_9BACL|nr:HepT-like ribonuclease domain-containing protein [Paenibacillus sabuli]MBD2846005.1 DUF86 domain-containing protein [Paenibacillus sabuli]
MYYVNRSQIDERLAGVPELADCLRQLAASWSKDALQGLAQERALHLAIETVTDVGSCLIDGFMMRDASSYEDIIEVISGERVFPEELEAPLRELVRLRKPLVQEYYVWQRSELHPLTPRLPEVLTVFSQSVRQYLNEQQL